MGFAVRAGAAIGVSRDGAPVPWGGGSYEPRRPGSYEPCVVRERTGGAYGDAGPDRGTGVDRETLPLDELGDEIARLAGHRHAATARFLRLVAVFDRRRGWEAGGHRSCAHWLVVRTGCSLRTARGYVRTARALEELPETSGAMARGALSYCQARALTRVATPGTEADLLRLAEGCTTSTLERRVRAWRKGGPRDEAAREEELHRSRRLTVACDGDGGYVIRGRLEPEVGAVLLRALEAAADALYRERRAGDGPAGGSYEPPSADPPSPRQAAREAARRRADAMGLLCERALAAGFGGGDDGDGGDSDDAPVSGTRAERYQAFLHVDLEALAEADGSEDADGTGPGRSELEDGTRLAPGTARRLCCDVAAVAVRRKGGEGSVLDVGRRTRTVPPALRRALEVRDRGCRFPGCGLRFCDAHHVVHWADGGETSLENTILLCRRHHRLVHEEGWTLEWWGKDDHAVFTDPWGKLHLDTGWEAPDLGEDPVAGLEREHRERGVDPGPLTASARWKRERSVPDEVWFRAHEAALKAVDGRSRQGAGKPG